MPRAAASTAAGKVKAGKGKVASPAVTTPIAKKATRKPASVRKTTAKAAGKGKGKGKGKTPISRASPVVDSSKESAIVLSVSESAASSEPKGKEKATAVSGERAFSPEGTGELFDRIEQPSKGSRFPSADAFEEEMRVSYQVLENIDRTLADLPSLPGVSSTPSTTVPRAPTASRGIFDEEPVQVDPGPGFCPERDGERPAFNPKAKSALTLAYEDTIRALKRVTSKRVNAQQRYAKALLEETLDPNRLKVIDSEVVALCEYETKLRLILDPDNKKGKVAEKHRPRYQPDFPALKFTELTKPSLVFQWVSKFRDEFVASGNCARTNILPLVSAKADYKSKGVLQHTIRDWSQRGWLRGGEIAWRQLTRLLLECVFGHRYLAQLQAEFNMFKRDPFETITSFNARFQNMMVFAEMEPTNPTCRVVWESNIGESTKQVINGHMSRYSQRARDTVSVEMLMKLAEQIEQGAPVAPMHAYWGKPPSTKNVVNSLRDQFGIAAIDRTAESGKRKKKAVKCAKCHHWHRHDRPCKGPLADKPRGKPAGKRNPHRSPGEPSSGQRCYNCGKPGHFAGLCPDKSPRVDSRAATVLPAPAPVPTLVSTSVESRAAAVRYMSLDDPSPEQYFSYKGQSN